MRVTNFRIIIYVCMYVCMYLFIYLFIDRHVLTKFIDLLGFYKFRPIQVDTDLATDAGSGESYGVNSKLYEHLFSMRYKNLNLAHVKSHSPLRG